MITHDWNVVIKRTALEIQFTEEKLADLKRQLGAFVAIAEVDGANVLDLTNATGMTLTATKQILSRNRKYSLQTTRAALLREVFRKEADDILTQLVTGEAYSGVRESNPAIYHSPDTLSSS